MEDRVITCVVNNFYYITAIMLVAFYGLIVLALDCWQK